MMKSYTLNSLSRWSCKSKILPDIHAVKAIHVYDFDNTLFSSPLPNPQLWSPPTVGLLQTYEVFAHGGWWHDPGILGATGEGIEKEEPRAWEGWWNDVVVQLAEASIAEKNVVTILLTGRGEENFADLINRICAAKKLDFDMIVLKPEIGPDRQKFIHTIDFKQEFLKDLILTYRDADTIRIYEDRVKHVKGFRDYLEKLNKSLISNQEGMASRKAITADVVHVCELKSSLDPEKEVIAVQTVINRNNKTIRSGEPIPTGAPKKIFQIKEHFLYFGYLISQTDSARLITLCNTSPHLIDSGEVKYMASSILIAPFYPRRDLVEKVGGRGNKVTWQVNGVAKFEDRIWAARVAPISDKQIHTQDETPMVVLAIRKGSRQIDAQRIKNWQPVAPEKQFIFETVVGDKVMLKIEELESNTAKGGDKSGSYRNKRKHEQEDEGRDKENHANEQGGSWAQNNKGGNGRYFNKSKQGFNNRRNNFNNGGSKNDQQGNMRPRGGAAGGGRRGGNRGPSGYKSLDDYGGTGGFDGANDSQAAQGGEAMVMNY